MSMKVLITGGAGFIGANFVHYLYLILKYLKKGKDLIQFVKDRPGHDRRYSLDTRKIRNLGWKPEYDFETSMKETIEWYKKNQWWWKFLVR